VRIKDISKEGRPRERFVKKGAGALSEAELFAIL
jgi:DNA repair protein RadC